MCRPGPSTAVQADDRTTTTRLMGSPAEPSECLSMGPNVLALTTVCTLENLSPARIGVVWEGLLSGRLLVGLVSGRLLVRLG